MASQFGRALGALVDSGDQTVACQLEGVVVVAGVLQQVDDRRSVAPVDSRPQGGSLLLGVHLRSLSVGVIAAPHAGSWTWRLRAFGGCGRRTARRYRSAASSIVGP